MIVKVLTVLGGQRNIYIVITFNHEGLHTRATAILLPFFLDWLLMKSQQVVDWH